MFTASRGLGMKIPQWRSFEKRRLGRSTPEMNDFCKLKDRNDFNPNSYRQYILAKQW